MLSCTPAFSRLVKKARKARKANPGLLDTWLLGPLLGLHFRLWTLAHTLGWTTNQPGLAGTVESCLVLSSTFMCTRHATSLMAHCQPHSPLHTVKDSCRRALLDCPL